MQLGVKDLLERQRDRCLGAILGVKDAELKRYLPPAVSVRLRKVVLDQINAYHAVVCDVLDSIDDGSVPLNELWLERLGEQLTEIHQAVVQTAEEEFVG